MGISVLNATRLATMSSHIGDMGEPSGASLAECGSLHPLLVLTFERHMTSIRTGQVIRTGGQVDHRSCLGSQPARK